MLSSVKASTNNVDRALEDAHHELRLSRQIASAHPGLNYLRLVQIPSQSRVCLVYEPMWEPLWLLQRRMI